MPLRASIRRHPVRTGVLAAAVVVTPVLAWLAFGYFGIQYAFIDQRVDEELTTFVDPGDDGRPAPDATPSPDPVPPPGDPATPMVPMVDAEPEPDPRPVRIATGDFSGRGRYSVSGEANVVQLPDGGRVLQLVELDSSNGPDLYVYLTAAGADEPTDAWDADFVDLGELRGNQGNQEYTIPDDVDLDRYATVVIWCERFRAGFGAAPLA